MTQFFLVDFTPSNDLDEDAEHEITLHGALTLPQPRYAEPRDCSAPSDA